jgi:hypothetical protein
LRLGAPLAAVLAAAASAGAPAQEREPVLAGTQTLTFEQSADRDGHGPPQGFAPRGSDRVHFTYGWGRDTTDIWWMEMDVLADDLPYGSRGASIAAFTFKRQNGDAAIPYRVLGGEMYAVTTSFTSARMLKGASLELQPLDRNAGILHSIVAFAGRNADEWKDFSGTTDRSVGLSWLAQPLALPEAHGGIHVVRNSIVSDDALGPGRRSQTAASVTASSPFNVLGARWRFEGEFATIRGDSGPGSLEEFQGRSGTAAYARLSGAHTGLGLEWNTQAERNGPDSASFASWSLSDRRRFESNAAWKWNGVTVAARHDATREEASSLRPRDDRGAGVLVTMPVPGSRAIWRTDAWRRSVRRGDGSEARASERAESGLELNTGATQVKLAASVQDDEDLLAHANDRRQRDLSLRVARGFLLGETFVNVAPRLTLQRIHAPGFTQRKAYAGGDLMLQRGVHGASLHVNGNTSRTGQELLPDVTTVASSIEYGYQPRGRHSFSFGYQALDVRVSPGVTSRRYTASLQWTIKLDQPEQATRVPPMGSLAAPAFVAGIPRDSGAIVAIPIGIGRDRLAGELASFGRGIAIANATVYDVEFLMNVVGRQRLAVVYDRDDRVEKVALLVRLDSASAADASRAYDRVLREMIERLGRPDTVRHEGPIRDTYVSDFSTGRVVRYAEWRLPDGVLRMGIPRRLDGIARIEVQRARALADARSFGWGLEAVD